MAKSLLVISRQAPWSGPSPREALDLVLAGGAFELPVSMLFLDDGVFQLLPGQQPQQLQQKDLGANLQALPLFGIDALYVASRSLAERGLEAIGPGLPAQALDDQALGELLARHDQVITI